MFLFFFIAKSLFGFSRLFFKLGGFISLFVRFILMTFPIGKYKAQPKVKYAKDKYDEENTVSIGDFNKKNKIKEEKKRVS